AYEVMMAIADAGDSAIIRCAQNRRVDGPLATAHQAVRSQPVLCRTTVEVDRTAGLPQRLAWVIPLCLADDLEPGGGLGAGAAPRGRAGALVALDAGAGGDGGGGPGGGAEIHLPVADRGGPLVAQERLPGGGSALGDLGGIGEGRDGQCGGGGADRVVAGSGAGDPGGPRDAGLDQRRGGGLGVPLRQG